MLHMTLRAVSLVLALGVTSVALAQTAPQTPPVLLQMIRDDSVHDALRMNEGQRSAVIDALAEIDGRWFRARNMQADKQQQEIATITSELTQKLSGILDNPQLLRLKQLQRQALGTRMVIRDDVAAALNLTKAQQQSFYDAFVETDRESSQIRQQLRKGEIDNRQAQKEIEALKTKERTALVAQLTDDQRSALTGLTGSPFDFGQVKRMYPLAPELATAGVTWIQGGPLKLSDLRGKVVAVHYYAFQCINCKRNLPHYKAWHDDYGEKDLVIIGIQTPETQTERKLDRVAQAAKADGIEYPVLLDAESSNWKAWSNTMWPTVYLIDKKGFIRRWWQGEMNWQGTPGEKQMRQTIEILLAEE